MPRPPLADEPFAYRVLKDGRVQISHGGRYATTLAGRAASKFIARVQNLDAAQQQLEMAKATGQFKFGNERTKRDR